MSDRPDTRIDDYNAIEKSLKSSDPTERRQASLAKDRLDRESVLLRKLRDDLVKAHRYRDKVRIEELHWKIKMEERRNGR